MDSLLVWDEENHPTDDYDTLIYWSSYTNIKKDKIFSLPLLVEEYAESLRSNYLKLIYEFGETRIGNQSIIEYLQIRQNFSYWWMTLLVEKCNYAKSPQIKNIIKLMALEKWLHENSHKKIQLVTLNNELADAFSLLSKKLLIDFEWKKINKEKNSPISIKKIFYSLPSIIQQPIWLLRYLVFNWQLKGVGVRQWRESSATTTFVSYLFNIIPEKLKQGEYGSRYWTDMVEVLDKKQYATNWLHIYVKSDLLPTAKKAREAIQTFNRQKDSRQTHATLASFLTITLIFHTLKDCYSILKLKKNVCKVLQSKSDYLWPLFKKDCQESMGGITAANTLLNFNLFERAMRELPIQKRGCYLQENMGWEFGFISAWKSAGHERNLLGFPHTTVIYWDLRNFFDPRSYRRKEQGGLPLPDYVGVNGKKAKQMYIDGGYPVNKLIEVESLRFLYLSYFPAHNNAIDAKGLKNEVVLVVGDYLPKNTAKQLKLLSLAADNLESSIHIIIKPHPACPIKMQDLPGLNCEISMQPIDELLLISDIVYASSVTSAAVDAYCTGRPVITILDGKSLNMSPLRGASGVQFVSTAKELAIAINGAEVNELEQREDYFYLDVELPRWREWLIGERHS